MFLRGAENGAGQIKFFVSSFLANRIISVVPQEHEAEQSNLLAIWFFIVSSAGLGYRIRSSSRNKSNDRRTVKFHYNQISPCKKLTIIGSRPTPRVRPQLTPSNDISGLTLMEAFSRPATCHQRLRGQRAKSLLTN